MNLDPSELLAWATSLTPDKMALVVPFIVAYIIIRTRTLNNNWIWIICTVTGAVLFTLLQSADKTKTLHQDITWRLMTGLVLGAIAAVLALGIHSVAFKWAADKWPMLKFLVLSDENENQPQPPKV